MLLRLLRVNLSMILAMALLALMALKANGRPQNSNPLDQMASKVLAMAGNMAEMVGNAGKVRQSGGFELPFLKGKSDTIAGTGSALRNSESSEEDRRRRKRSLNVQLNEDSLEGEEYLLALPVSDHHYHRDKRSPCKHGGGGGGTGGAGGAIDYDDNTDLAERRRRGSGRKGAAARKRNQQNKINNKKKLVNNEDIDDETQVVTRRKRQTELDDLNQNMANANKDFSQHAQQLASKLQNIWDSFKNSMNDMAQRFKQHITGQNSTDMGQI